MRTQLGAPVSLIVVILGFALVYYAFHSNGWTWNGNVAPGYVYRSMLYQSRILVVCGFVLSAWGLGKLYQCAFSWRTRQSASAFRFKPSRQRVFDSISLHARAALAELFL